MDQGHLVWRDPARDETAHLEIIPIERDPGAGEYTLRATVETPRFRRHGDESERPELMDDAQVEFENVMIDVDA
jgi:hypothetical protein